MYFAQRVRRSPPPISINANPSTTSSSSNTSENTVNNNNNILAPNESIDTLLNNEHIGWHYSSRFLNSALNAACVSNEIKSGTIQMETASHKWCYFYLSISPVPGIGLVLRRFTKPPHLQQRIEDTIAVSYLLIPSRKEYKCKINIVEEMIHVCIESDTKGVVEDFFCCTKDVAEAREWGDTLLKGLASGESSSKVKDAIPSRNSGVKHQTIEKTMLSSLEMGGEAVIKTYEERQQQRIDEFVLVFLICPDEKLRTIGSNGGLEKSSLRSLCWFSFLKYFPIGSPTSLWPSIIKKSRQFYERARVGLWNNSSKTTNTRQSVAKTDFSQKLNSTTSSPTSCVNDNINSDLQSKHTLGSEASGANVCEKQINYDLIVDIEKDVTRTHNKIAFFRHPKIREAMIRILLVYALNNVTISYKQGMNDLVATILLLLHRERLLISNDYSNIAEHSDDKNYCLNGGGYDKANNDHFNSVQHNNVNTPSPEAENVDVFLDDKYIEHDAYIIFSLIMNRMEIVFCPNDSIKTNLLKSNQWINGNVSSVGEDILTRLVWIQNIRLKRLNEHLPIHFLKLGIQPHMYLLPWIRLIFAREYCMEGLWLVWDAIFAISPSDFTFSNYICVAMIAMCEDELMALQDMASVLMFLQKPKLRSVAEALLVIDKAKVLWNEDFPLAILRNETGNNNSEISRE
jgi:hypothetical protein